MLIVVDDDEALLYSFRRMMAREPFALETFAGGTEAVDRVQRGDVAVAVVDVRLGSEMDGSETLRRIKALDPKISVILMTAYASANTAIEATRHGAYDYVIKPFETEEMRDLIHRAHQAHEAMSTAVHLVEKEQLETPEDGDCIIGLSPAMQDVYKKIGRAASSGEPVLIRGESGTGKELVARALFQFSSRKDCLFLPINCAAIPENLMESELFGHEKGSFTGAHERKIGKFEQADGGTVFLDEIGETSLETQVKLLRFLEDKRVTPVGSPEGRKVDVRVLAATNCPLEDHVKAGRFREDLYYRLNVVTIDLPPLRERSEDIPPLVRYFLAKHTHTDGTEVPAILPETVSALSSYDWPGNVRELENTIRRVLVHCRGHAISQEDLGLGGGLTAPTEKGTESKSEDTLPHHLSRLLYQAKADIQIQGACFPVLEQIERMLVEEAIALTGGNQVQASRILGMSRNTLRKRIASIEDKENAS